MTTEEDESQAEGAPGGSSQGTRHAAQTQLFLIHNIVYVNIIVSQPILVHYPVIGYTGPNKYKQHSVSSLLKSSSSNHICICVKHRKTLWFIWNSGIEGRKEGMDFIDSRLQVYWLYFSFKTRQIHKLSFKTWKALRILYFCQDNLYYIKLRGLHKPSCLCVP